MRRALCLAKCGAGRVHPNPLVGAVLVKAGKVIAEGAHLEFGGPHAEVHAILKAGRAAAGSTLYVNLEPCAHTGKTLPCTDLILKSKIKKVVAGIRDPNPLVSGKGFRRLRAGGVAVIHGVLRGECLELNRDFFHWIRHRTPYVILKSAQSLDGKIATQTGESRWITGPAARVFAHRLRASADAILVGVNTLLKDDPLLSVRLGKGGRFPARPPVKIVLDSRLRTPLGSRIFRDTPPSAVWLVASQRVSRKMIARYKGRAEILLVKEKGAGRVDFEEALKTLGERGIVRLLIEGGGEVASSALFSGAVHELFFLVAPKIIGGKASIASVGGQGARFLNEAISLSHWKIKKLGADFLVHGIVGS